MLYEVITRLAYLSLLSNFAVFFAAVWVSIVAVQHHAWIAAALGIVVLAFAGVRLYVLQHDLGHLSLFETKAQNEFVITSYSIHYTKLYESFSRSPPPPQSTTDFPRGKPPPAAAD